MTSQKTRVNQPKTLLQTPDFVLVLFLRAERPSHSTTHSPACLIHLSSKTQLRKNSLKRSPCTLPHVRPRALLTAYTHVLMGDGLLSTHMSRQSRSFLKFRTTFWSSLYPMPATCLGNCLPRGSRATSWVKYGPLPFGSYCLSL